MGLVPRGWRSRRDRWVALLVLGMMAAVVAGVYLVVVLGGGALIGRTDEPQIWLSVLATAIVALAFEPLQVRLERWASRLVYGGRQPAYETLSRFSNDLGRSTGTGDLPDRMAQVLGEGTGVRWTQVWLMVNDRPVLAGRWPAQGNGSDPTPPGATEPRGRRSREVALAGRPLGVLRLQEHDGQTLTQVEERLFSGLAAQAGVVLHGARLRAELAERLDELSSRADELSRSRERLVDTQDSERRQLERDIHDGAQQHLVALAVNLRLAETLAYKSPARAADVLADQVEASETAIQTLVDLSRGIYPRVLGEAGIGDALRAVADTGPIRVTVTDAGLGRLPDDVESAVYFCCLEALQNAAKHSGASEVTIELERTVGRLVWVVSDDGVGFGASGVEDGEGLANIRDRMDALGGQVDIDAPPSGGVRIRAWVPLTGPVVVP
jgi:signal transduction histidine kinase